MSTTTLFKVVKSRLQQLYAHNPHPDHHYDFLHSSVFSNYLLNCFDSTCLIYNTRRDYEAKLSSYASRLSNHCLFGLLSLDDCCNVSALSALYYDDTKFLESFVLDRHIGSFESPYSPSTPHSILSEYPSINNLLPYCPSSLRNGLYQFCNIYASRFPLCAFKWGNNLVNSRRPPFTAPPFFDKAPFLLVEFLPGCDFSITFTESYEFILDSFLRCKRLLLYSPLPYFPSHILEGSSLTPMPLISDYFTTKQSAFLDLLCQ